VWGWSGLVLLPGSRRKVGTFDPAKMGGKGIPTFRLRNQARALKCHRKSLWSKAAKAQVSERIRLSESDSAYRSGIEPPSLMRECPRQLGFLTVLETAERVWSGAAIGTGIQHSLAGGAPGPQEPGWRDAQLGVGPTERQVLNSTLNVAGSNRGHATDDLIIRQSQSNFTGLPANCPIVGPRHPCP
jgi:hypothetical protein